MRKGILVLCWIGFVVSLLAFAEDADKPAANAAFPRWTPLEGWQLERTEELFEMALGLDARTRTVRLHQGTPEDIQAVNAQLENWKKRTSGSRKGTYSPGWGGIDLYMMMYQHPDRLTEAAKRKILEVLEEYSGPGGYAYGCDFSRMINTNHPTNATMALVLAGQLMGKPERVARGRRQIRYLLDWLRDVGPGDVHEQFAERRKATLHGRRDLSSGTGDIDEYNSPTYQAVTLTGLAGLSCWATDPEIALKARLMQEHLFLLTTARYHPDVRIVCGPYSRSYPMNTAGVVGNLYYVLHRYLKNAPPLDPHLSNKEWGPGSADIYWIPKIAAMPYYFPPYLRRIGDEKQYPYTVQVTTKSGNWGDYPYGDGKTRLNAPGGRCDLTSYLAADWCLGSSSRYYAYAGQNENCILYWRKRPVRKVQDRKFMIARYLINDRDPFDNTRDGLPHTFQVGGKVIVLFHPAMRPSARRMRAWVGFFDDYDPIDQVYVGNRPVDQSKLPLDLKEDDVLFVHDGPVHVAVRAIPGQNLGVQGSVLRLAKESRCLGLSAYNYESDEALPLSLQKVPVLNPMRFIRGGFVIEVSDRGEYPNPADFRKHILAAQVKEEVLAQKVRKVSYTSGGKVMALTYDMDRDRIVSRRLDGLPYQCPPLACPDARMDFGGIVTVHGATLLGKVGTPLLLYAPGPEGPFVVTQPTDEAVPLELAAPGAAWKTRAFGCGQLRLWTGETPRLEIDRLKNLADIQVRSDSGNMTVVINGQDVTDRLKAVEGEPGWLLVPSDVTRAPQVPVLIPPGTVKVNARDGAAMVWVPATREFAGRNMRDGAFLMGSFGQEVRTLSRSIGAAGELFHNEQPAHPVTLDGFWMYRTEVTNAQYSRFCHETGRPTPGHFVDGKCPAGMERLPVVRVTWLDATAYAHWAGAELPTEAQWEWAARGPERRTYPWGDHWDPKRLRWAGSLAGREFTGLEQFQRWFGEWSRGKRLALVGPAPVGSYPDGASWCGALDLAGNVWEFCRDRYYSYESQPQTNPIAPDTGDKNVTRGGSWMDFSPHEFRGAARWMTDGDRGFRASDTGGFRCVIVPG